MVFSLSFSETGTWLKPLAKSKVENHCAPAKSLRLPSMQSKGKAPLWVLTWSRWKSTHRRRLPSFRTIVIGEAHKLLLCLMTCASRRWLIWVFTLPDSEGGMCRYLCRIGTSSWRQCHDRSRKYTSGHPHGQKRQNWTYAVMTGLASAIVDKSTASTPTGLELAATWAKTVAYGLTSVTPGGKTDHLSRRTSVVPKLTSGM